MYTIGIIEDNDDYREKLCENLKMSIEDELKIKDVIVLAISPFKEKTRYVSWIQENNISVILTDERLYEVGGKEYGDGHSVIEYLRPYFPGLRFYIITSYNDDKELLKNQSVYLINKKTFSHGSDEEKKEKKNILHLILDSARTFYNQSLTEIITLKEISEKIALGTATKDELEKAKQIQSKLELPASAYDNSNRKLWLKEFEEELGKFEELENRINEFLNNDNELEVN